MYDSFATPWTEACQVRPWDSPGRVLVWVAIPFSWVSFQPRDQTWVSYISGEFFSSSEPPGKPYKVMVWCTVYRVGPSQGDPSMCLTRRTTEKDPRQESPLCAWMGRIARETGQRGLLIASYQRLEQRLWLGHNPAGRQSCPCTLGVARLPTSQAATPPSCQSHWGRAATGKKSFVSVCAGSLWSCLTLWSCRLWLFRLLCQGGGFSRQEHWSILANTGCHTLLEHFISCCPGRQIPWVSGVVRTPATQAAAPPPHLASQGKPKPSRAASGANPSGRPTCRGGNTMTIETQRQCG